MSEILNNENSSDVEAFKLESEYKLKELEAKSAAKEVAGKSIGKNALFYITLIVLIGVVSSLFLEEAKMAAVMGLLGASLSALISMLNGIAGAEQKEEKPEFEVMKELIVRLDNSNQQELPMSVSVNKDEVLVKKGNDEVVAKKDTK